MLAVDSKFRKLKIGSTLVRKAIERMVELDADEVNFSSQEILALRKIMHEFKHKSKYYYYFHFFNSGCLRNRNNQPTCSAIVRKPWFCSRQKVISILLERSGCATIKAMA